jgi:putative MATE family efflux protein
MQDLTTGSITRHLLKTMSFMLLMMVFQTLYVLIDLYWVGRLGTASVAAVGIAGNLMFVVLALTQMLAVGTTTVVSQAIGRRDNAGARLGFNQSLSLGMLCGALFLVVGLLLRLGYASSQSADPETARQAARYLLWFIPAMALQFPLVSMSAALRGVGNFKLGVAVGILTIVINMVLAPILIFGWLGAPAMGIGGAAVASLVAIAVGDSWLALHFRGDALLSYAREEWRPRVAIWKRMLGIGLPSGFDFAMMAVYLFIVYAVTRPFGAAAQAGFGIGMRIMQAGFMPVVALGMSVAPIVGQNFGARQADRVRRTFRDGALLGAGMMLLFFILCHVAPSGLVRIFTKDPAVIAVGDEYLRIISWNFVAAGVNFVMGSMFQGMGNTLPSIATSLVRILIVTVPVLILARSPGFELATIWHLAVVSVWMQLVVGLMLLRREFGRRLRFAESEAGGVAVLPVLSKAPTAEDAEPMSAN